MSTINDLRQLLKHKLYRNILLSRTISRFGDSLDMVAYAWIAYEITQSAFIMGLLYACNVLPNLIISPLIGPIVNFVPHKPIIVVGDMLRATLVLIVALLYQSGYLVTWHLFVFTSLNSLVEVIVAPVKSVVFKQSLPSDLYASANTLGETIVSGGQLFGVAIAGFIIGVFGAHTALLIDSFTFFASAMIMLVSRFPAREVVKATRSSYLQSLKAGYCFIFNERVIKTLLLLFMTANFLLTPINALAVIYVQEVMRIGPNGMSVFSVSITVGLIVGGVVANKFLKELRSDRAIIIPMLAIGVAFSALGLQAFVGNTPLRVASVALALFLMGAVLPTINAFVMTYIMKRTPDDIFGQVRSFTGMLTMIFQPIGAAVFGVLGGLTSISTLFITNGVIMLLIVTLSLGTRAVKTLKAYQNIEAVPTVSVE